MKRLVILASTSQFILFPRSPCLVCVCMCVWVCVYNFPFSDLPFFNYNSLQCLMILPLFLFSQ